jgi:hypothetical protein
MAHLAGSLWHRSSHATFHCDRFIMYKKIWCRKVVSGTLLGWAAYPVSQMGRRSAFYHSTHAFYSTLYHIRGMVCTASRGDFMNKIWSFGESHFMRLLSSMFDRISHSTAQHTIRLLISNPEIAFSMYLHPRRCSRSLSMIPRSTNHVSSQAILIMSKTSPDKEIEELGYDLSENRYE